MAGKHLVQRFIFFIFILFFLLSSGCAVFKKRPPDIPKTTLCSLSCNQYPEFEDDLDFDNLHLGIQQSLNYLKRLPADREFRFGNDVFHTLHMIRSIEYFTNFIQSRPSQQQLRQFIKQHYCVYRSIGDTESKNVMFTGYYEPLLKGRLAPTEVYKFPLYAPPSDLVTIDLSLFSHAFKGKKIVGRYTNQTVVPYYSRKEIDALNALAQTAKPLVWVDDRIDLFFLQIQGSGKVELDNGQTINVHYAGANGHPYRSIGKLLIDEGMIPRKEMSMQKIKTHLEQHPDEVQRIFNSNPSYVFFKIEKDGPLGCLNVPLTPGRSIATDQRIFPSAALVYIQTQKPLLDGSEKEKIQGWIDFGRFVMNQDTGGAIRGPGRADLFWGNGAYAEIAAGHLQHPGSLYFLVLKPGVVQ